MRVAIRTDASLKIGSGHVMRCLTLAKQLNAAGADIQFICRDHAGHNYNEIVLAGFELTVLRAEADGRTVEGDEYAHWLGVSPKEDAKQTIGELNKKPNVDWMIVDHYALDRQWEKAIRSSVENIMVIDDLANREHDCDLLLDQNLYEKLNSRYDKLVPQHCIKKLGPEHALLRDEFFDERKKLTQSDGVIRKIFIFYGGSDNSGETLKALKAILSLITDSIKVDIVVGSSNKDRDEIKTICSNYENLMFHSNISNMAELMASADLALGAGGTTTGERYCLGLPTIVTAVAANQVEAAEFAYKSGLNYYIGKSDDVTPEIIGSCINRLADDSKALRKVSQKLLDLYDGRGVDIVEDLLFEKA